MRGRSGPRRGRAPSPTPSLQSPAPPWGARGRAAEARGCPGRAPPESAPPLSLRAPRGRTQHSPISFPAPPGRVKPAISRPAHCPGAQTWTVPCQWARGEAARRGATGPGRAWKKAKGGRKERARSSLAAARRLCPPPPPSRLSTHPAARWPPWRPGRAPWSLGSVVWCVVCVACEPRVAKKKKTVRPHCRRSPLIFRKPLFAFQFSPARRLCLQGARVLFSTLTPPHASPPACPAPGRAGSPAPGRRPE